MKPSDALTERPYPARTRRLAGYAFVILLSALGCVDPYTPPSTIVDYKFLVVDGVLSTNSTDTSQFSLSRTSTLSSQDSTAETKATVVVEEENGGNHTLISDGAGTYKLPPGVVDASKRVRMHIIDGSGKEYLSEYVGAVTTPPIDNVTYDTTTLNSVYGVQIYVSTHDATNTTKYFLWRFEETWSYTSEYPSSLIQIRAPNATYDTVTYRLPDQQIAHCFSTQLSRLVLINSTTDLSADIVTNFPITHIPRNSPKLHERYSILVRQYAITSEAYEYWVALKKNTESLGSIFGSLPVTVTGNFTCVTDPSTPVFGFFSATAAQSQRIFIETFGNPLITPVNYFDPFYQGCEVDTVAISSVQTPSTSLFLDAAYKGLTLVGFTTSSRRCSDCREHGGTLTKPPFW